MADRQRQTNKFNFRGLNTRLLPDAMPLGKAPVAVNVRADGDSKIKTRPGYNLSFITGGLPATDMRAISTLNTDNQPRIIVHDSGGGVWLDDGVKKGTVGTGGLGASLIPYRPNQSPQSWMYICNATGYKKFQAPDSANTVVVQKVGIAEPQTPPEACPDGLAYNEFTSNAAGWTASGTAAGPADATRSTDTAVAIFQDPASVSPATKTRYSVQVGAVAYSIGETLTFNKSGGGTFVSVIEDIFPPINAGAVLTVQSIIYLFGPAGRCVVVPSQLQVDANNSQLDANDNPAPLLPLLPGQIAGLRRGALVSIGGETTMVLSVTTGPQGQLSFECVTQFTHSAGESVIGKAAIAVAGISSLVVGQTFTAAQITSAITTGVGTLTQVLGSNPFTQALGSIGTPQENDHIHLSIASNAPNNIIEFKIEFDVGDGTFTQNVLYYSISPSVIQATIANATTQLTAVQNQAEQDLIRRLVAADPEHFHFRTIGNNPGDPLAPGTAASGGSQFAEVIIPISQLTRTGNDQTKTLANCNRVQILVNCSGNMTLIFGSVWVGGGGQPDIGDAISANPTPSNAPYLYRVRPRSNLTGAKGNPSPATRYGVSPHRQKVIISLPSASYDTQIDTWDIERYGGTVLSWRRVGTADASATTFVDDVFDDAAGEGELLEFDNFEPWPSVDVPWKITVGSGGITGISVTGTVIKVSGTTFPSTIANWLPGTLITLNGQVTYTLWSRPIGTQGGYVFRLLEGAGSPTVTTLVVNEPVVANQNLPYMWGPDANGIFFAVGDPLRPGGLYSAKQFSPDSSPNNVYDLTAPSEPLMGGEVVDGLSLVASSVRWWQLQADFSQPKRWNPIETPAGRGLAAPFGSCTDGKFLYFWSKDGIYSMIPGLPATSLTDADLDNLFPQDGVPGTNVTYGAYTFYAPDYKRAASFRLSIVNSILRAHYLDSEGIQRTISLDLTIDSEGTPRMAWSADVMADPIRVSYQPEQPSGTLTTTSTAYKQAYFADTVGKVYTEQDLSNDNGVAITAALATIEWDGGDSRIQRQWLDAMVDAIPASGILVTPMSGGLTAGTPVSIATSSTRIIPPSIVPLGSPIRNFLGVILSWTDNFNTQAGPTTLFQWSEECVPQPALIRTWQSVPTSHGLESYHHIRKLVFAYLTKGANPVTLTITSFDGTSPTVLTLPATNGAYQKAEFVPTFNKGLLYTYVGSSSDMWAPILEDCEVHVGAWARSGPYAVFTDLGGREAV